MKIKDIFGKCIAVFEWFIGLILVVLIILTFFQRFSNQHNFFGYRIYTVASGSMIPTYNIGDTLLVKEMDAEGIKEGDAVTYIGDDPGIDGMIITHQVQKVEIGEDGKYYFHTKGVANYIEDPIISEDQVLGKVIYRFFFLSLLGKITTNKLLLFCFVAIPFAILIAIEIIKLVYQKDEEDEEEIPSFPEALDNVINKMDTEAEKNDIIKEDKEVLPSEELKNEDEIANKEEI